MTTPNNLSRIHVIENWFSVIPLTAPDEDSDLFAVDNDLVSLTPLRLSLTDDEWLQNMQVERESFFLGQR